MLLEYTAECTGLAVDDKHITIRYKDKSVVQMDRHATELVKSPKQLTSAADLVFEDPIQPCVMGSDKGIYELAGHKLVIGSCGKLFENKESVHINDHEKDNAWCMCSVDERLFIHFFNVPGVVFELGLVGGLVDTVTVQQSSSSSFQASADIVPYFD